MKRRSLGLTTASVLVSLWILGTGTALAQQEVADGKATLSGEVTGSGQFYGQAAGSKQKFNEYRDVYNGAVINRLKLGLVGHDPSTYLDYLDLDLKKPLADDQSNKFSVGKLGKFDLDLVLDSTPHRFTDRKILFAGVGSDRLTVPEDLRRALQAVEQTRAERGGDPLVDTTGEDALTNRIIRDAYGSTRTRSFQIQRDKMGISLNYWWTKDIKSWAKVEYEKRDGERVISVGTYERYPQGAAGLTHREDRFLVSTFDLAEPVDYNTVMTTLGTGIYRQHWLTDVEYRFTKFSNENTALRWENPFRVTDAAATTAGGGAGNAFNRGRFVTGQIALAPDSTAHDFSWSGAVDLPLNSRFAANVGVGWITQDTAFVPYTLNTALSPVAGFDVTDRNRLPQGDLDGKVRTFTQSYSLTSKPIEPLTLTAKYRYNDYDDSSDKILFPGYAAFGESFWRTRKNDRGAKVQNEPFSYTKQNADLIVDYHVLKPLALSVEGGWERWTRENLRITNTDEQLVGGGFTYKPVAWATWKGNYKYGHRGTDGYLNGNTPANPEAVRLVNYDWSDRDRHKTDTRLQFTPTDKVTVGLSAQSVYDEYDKDSRFGLKRVNSNIAAVDVSYTPVQRLTLHADYSIEYRKSFMKNGAKDDAFNADTPIDDTLKTDAFNPLNYWNTNIYERVNTLGTGVTFDLIPTKLSLDTGYAISYSDMEFHTWNPNGPAKLRNGIPNQWPHVINTLQEIKAAVNYRVTKDLRMGLSYLFEWNKLKDFAWDKMSNTMAGQSAENSVRSAFADATYKGYEAHVLQFTLSYRF